MIPVSHVFLLAGVIFSIGMLGLFIRRNLLVIFMSIELMFNAANIAFVGAGNMQANLAVVSDGFASVPFVMAVAAAEAAVGLALVVAMYRATGDTDVELLRRMKG
ncbi:MAG: NADH-quinone oxidoreductase subunit NuoK [Candidatus Riflebacteria bacterium]|nr:NADH-quinone oxidoreductase subunit NuoK [Candidatus Riflebacteria bacterium]